MAYAAWSVVAGEQPTAAKWNILGTNDASFNDGTGIGTNAIAAASLATTAITLGYAEITSNFSTSSTSFVDVTGLTVTVTVPAGGRRILIMIGATGVNTGSTGIWNIALLEDGNYREQWYRNQDTATANNIPFTGYFSKVPSSGSHTYKVQLSTTAGTATISAGTTSSTVLTPGPASIIALMI